MNAEPRCRPPVKVTATSRKLFGKAPKCLFCRKPAMVRWGLVLRELSEEASMSRCLSQALPRPISPAHPRSCTSGPPGAGVP